MSCWSVSRSLAFDTPSILCSSRVSFCFPESWGFWSSVSALSVLSCSSRSQIVWLLWWANSKHWVWAWVVVQLVRWYLHWDSPSDEGQSQFFLCPCLWYWHIPCLGLALYACGKQWGHLSQGWGHCQGQLFHLERDLLSHYNSQQKYNKSFKTQNGPQIVSCRPQW